MNNTSKHIDKIQRWIPLSWVEATNSSLDNILVNEICRDFNLDFFGALPGIFVDYGEGKGVFRITDGNHRFEAAKKLGEKYVPIVLLTDEEYLLISYSKNYLDFRVRRTQELYKNFPFHICTKLQHV